jgi:hypothetical protein
MGGVVPLGYRVENRALHIVEDDAAVVRRLYEDYLRIGSVVKLHHELIERDITVPARIDGKGNSLGGGRFSRGHLYKLLSNPIYVGDLGHRGAVHPGAHPALVTRELWNEVQQRLAEQTRASAARCRTSPALLIGKLRDAQGILFSPSFAVRRGRRYRYYISRALLDGRAVTPNVPTRIPAGEVESLVSAAVRSQDEATRRMDSTQDASPDASRDKVASPQTDRNLVQRHVAGVVLHADQIEITLASIDDGENRSLIVPWAKTASTRRKDVLVPQEVDGPQPLKAEVRDKLLRAVARARQWLDQLTSGTIADTDAIAERVTVSERLVRKQLSLAFLAPDIVEHAIAGRLPRGLGLTRLLDLPASWSAQRRALGLPASR